MTLDPPLTVGGLRRLIADLHDDLDIVPRFYVGFEPGDGPGVKLERFMVGEDPEGPALFVDVSLVYFDEIDDEEEEEGDV